MAALDLALENVDALAVEEAEGIFTGDYVSFTFNGSKWWGIKDGSSSKWFPKYDGCFVDGSHGVQVYCIKGDGNCWNGTDCLK